MRVGIAESHAYRDLENHLRFPGLSIAPSARPVVSGRVVYGPGCSIGEGANLIVPASAVLCLGEGVYVGRYVELGPGDRIEIGDYTSIQDRSLLVGDVSIGRYCSLSLNVLMTSGRHYFELRPELLVKDQDILALADSELKAQHSRPVCVEDDCWLGVNAVIMPGVTVSKGCVVGANSVVTRDLPPYSVAVGAPARTVRTRLNFRPPRSIESSRDADLPYFYSGCGISRAELAQGREQGGILAGARFSLALDGTGGRELWIAVRGRSAEPCSLALGEQVEPVGRETQRLRYPIGSGSPQRFYFRVAGADGERWPVSIQAAGVL